jgi:hypothetical protein
LDVDVYLNDTDDKVVINHRQLWRKPRVAGCLQGKGPSALVPAMYVTHGIQCPDHFDFAAVSAVIGSLDDLGENELDAVFRPV